MAIVYTFDKDGAFIAGDTKTRMTTYSYPSSSNAAQAKRMLPRNRLMFAGALMKAQTRHGFTHEIDYDHRNWVTLDAATA